MQMNEFNRRLHSCHLDQESKYLLSHLFEVQVELSKYMDIATRLLENLTGRLQAVIGINDTLIEQIRELQRRGMVDGVEVHSVRNEPE